MSKEIRVSLGQKEFRALVRGGQVEIKRQGGPNVLLLLQDIGWHIMAAEVGEAVDDSANGDLLSFEEESIEVEE